MLRTLLAGVLIASGVYASRVVNAPLDDMLVCYEDHPSHTVVRYVAGEWVIMLLDTHKTGSLDPQNDRIIAYTDRVMHTYYHDGVLESTIFEREGEFFIGAERFFGAYYRAGERILENEADREGFAAAQLRFEHESGMLARFAEAFADYPVAWLATCDPIGLLGRRQ